MEQEIRTRLGQKRYREAFELLVSEYQDKVFRLAYAMLGNRALADETAQDIFVRIWKALGGYRGQASLSTWIYSIARNTCLTARKRNAAREALSIDEPDVRLAAEMQRAGGRSQGETLDLPFLLGQLPERHRQALILFYLEERSYEEVARLLDLPMGTVKAYLHRARKELAAAVVESRMTRGGR
jgi:RNA polymerase sigma-70 factor (ECF subfamily)